MFDVWSNKFSQDIFLQKYSKDGIETWEDTCKRVVDAVCSVHPRVSKSFKEDILDAMVQRKFIPGGRYLYAAGRDFHQVNNCFLFRAEDSREGWSDLVHKSTMSLMTGGGIGVDYSDIRHEGSVIKKTGGFATGPIALMKMVNENGRYIMQGGQRRSAIWAGLLWSHPDIHKFITIKNYTQELKDIKTKDFTFPLTMELTNISVNYDDKFFEAMDADDSLAKKVWIDNCTQAFSTAEPGMAFNARNPRESLRNACTEVTSEDDSDKCNLGTVWMNRCSDLSEFSKICEIATEFLILGGIYSHVPTEKISEVGKKNNRIGLGLGGMHEWLMVRGSKYEVTSEMHAWLAEYAYISDMTASYCAEYYGVTRPAGVRAIAPTGTIGILAETTTGIEPLFCKAYLRRYFKNGVWKSQYVVDGAVKRLLSQGVLLENIQDSYDIGFEERIKFQADVQDYVDMAISSTCNMAQWGTENNNFTNVEENAAILLKYAKRLRGFTCYPDACRGGQPLTRVGLDVAMAQEGVEFVENEAQCVNGVCGV